MNPAILGIGLALPPFSIDPQASAALVASLVDGHQAGWLSRIHQRAAARARRSVLLVSENDQRFYEPARPDAPLGPTTSRRLERFAREAPPLAADACAHALAEVNIAPERITHLITVTCTGFVAPGIDAHLVRTLGLRPDTQRTTVGFMGCHGAINGLRVARAIARADPHAHVLLCAVELCSLHLQYGPAPDAQIANALFADGAAAAVIAPSGHPHSPRIRDSFSLLLPDTSDLMSWRIGDHGFVMSLSPRLPDVIRKHLQAALNGWLTRHRLTVRDVPSWAIHPGGPRILQSVQDALNLSPQAMESSRRFLGELGNMSSPTVLFILRDLVKRRAPRPIVMLGFGPGLAVEAALIA